MSLRKEVITRSISAVIVGSAVLFITWWNPISFALLCLLGGVILSREWWGLTRRRSRWFMPLGATYIGATLGCLIFLRQLDVNYIYFLFALVWVGDITGYVVGKAIGRHKIAPGVSPGKSWEGLAGAIIATGCVMFFIGQIVPWWYAGALGGMVAVLGLLGDLFESHLKRRAGVKDSGTLMPGHGGLFDRVDALMPVAIFMAVCVRLMMLQAMGA